MKKFLAIALLLVLVASVFIVASTAAEAPTYWSISSNCLVKAKVLDDGTVPTFKEVSTDNGSEGLLVGIPTNAVLGDSFFQAKDGYTIEYLDKDDNEITSSTAHIGTTDKVVVYKDGAKVAEYGLVTYGDADGDGVFDVIDAAIAALCLGGKMSEADNPAVYESVKPRAGVDNDSVEAEDYQQIVNDSVKDESELEENLKGRKTPIDETLSFESIIYANTGATRTAAITANDSNFNSLITINYNGSATAPSASGIYEITAVVPESEQYLVTPGTRNLGFIAIAPKTSDGYKVSVDNASKKITVDINNSYTSDTTFDGYISGWYNTNYNLTMAGTAISDGTAAVSALSPRTFVKYWQEAITDSDGTTTRHQRFTDLTDVLGCYLPDDYTLWNDENANKTVAVSVDDSSASPLSFNLVIQQDKEEIKKSQSYFGDMLTSQSRGERTDNPATSANGSDWLGRDIKLVYVETKRKYNSTTGSRENTIRVVNGGSATRYPSMTDAFDGTGLKTVLLGYYDAIMFESGASKDGLSDITSSSNVLYDTDKDNRRYANYSGTEIALNSSKFMGLINDVLGGMNVNVNLTSKTSALLGKSGWCRYACAGKNSGLRYICDYYLEFADADSTNDNHNTISVTAVDGCTIATDFIPQYLVDVGIVDNTSHTKFEGYNSRMLKDEAFRVSATLASGYTLSVTDASGNAVEYDAENDWYIMPNSNVTVTAVKA